MQDNNELMQELQAATSKEERGTVYGKLYGNNRGIIWRICSRWSSAKVSRQTREGKEVHTGILTLDDLMQEAYFFLVKAADRYITATQEEQAAATFTTYLSNTVEWGFIRYFSHRHRYINDERRIVRLNETLENGEGTGSERIEFIADESQNVEGSAIARIYSEDVERIFLDTIKDYPPPARELLFRRLILGHSLKAIADGCGKSTERIRQLYKNALKTLRNSDIRARLAEIEQDEEDASIAYKTGGFKFWKEHGLSSVELMAIKHEWQQREPLRTREQRRAALYGLVDLL